MATKLALARLSVMCLIACYIAIVIYSAYHTTTIVDRENNSVLQSPLINSNKEFSSSHQKAKVKRFKGSSSSSSANDLQEKQQQQHPEKTLALLYPPGMIGGYRNQVLRFMAFVSYATKHNITQLFVPSILWSTQYKDQHLPEYKSSFNNFYPIPMDTLFDIQHWNTYSSQQKQNNKHYYLPKLVYELQQESNNVVDDNDDETCWIGRRRDGRSIDINNNGVEKRFGGLNRDMTSHNTSNSTNTSTSYFVSPMLHMFEDTTPFLTKELGDISLDILAGKIQLNPRRIDYLPNVTNCTNPYVYGGGRGAGRLWNDYLTLPKQVPGEEDTKSTSKLTSTDKDKEAKQQTTDLMRYMSRALIPAPQWRNVARECIVSQQQQQQESPRQQQQSLKQLQQEKEGEEEDEEPWPSYVALHARVEVDMMIHKCGKKMEKNLTKIFDMVNEYVSDYNSKLSAEQQQEGQDDGQQLLLLQGIFVAVSRSGMMQPPPSKDTRTQQLAKENWQILIERSSSNRLDRTYYGLSGGNTTTTKTITDNASTSSSNNKKTTRPLLVECGELWMDSWYETNKHTTGIPDDYYGSLLPSMMNFYLATQSTVFVGVAKSSWSTDVWMTRYYQGKGNTNYEYTTDAGIRLLPNGGLPPPHKNC